MSPQGVDASQAPPSGCDLLFVYGSLRRSASHHHILERLHVRFVCPGSVSGQLFDLGRFPGAKPWASERAPTAAASLDLGLNRSGRVAGELYQLRNPVRDLAVLDRYEDFRPASPAASFFRRELARVRTRDGSVVEAWVYWLNRTSVPRRAIASGDYPRRNIAGGESR